MGNGRVNSAIRPCRTSSDRVAELIDSDSRSEARFRPLQEKSNKCSGHVSNVSSFLMNSSHRQLSACGMQQESSARPAFQGTISFLSMRSSSRIGETDTLTQKLGILSPSNNHGQQLMAFLCFGLCRWQLPARLPCHSW